MMGERSVRTAGSEWREWTYADWNRCLLEYHFTTTGSALHDPVERIPATPDELVVVAGDATAHPSAVVSALVARIREQLPYGRESFSGYCLDYQGWSVESSDYPRFFGMLWLTCLIAYGYPRTEIPFYPRLHEAIRKKDNLQYRLGNQNPSCLPRLWEDLRAWTLARREKNANVRELLLPADVGRRTAIGYSWFLAFPHQRDRLELAKCLWERELVGPEPPIEPVVALLKSRRDNFSPEFGEDLDDFIEKVLNRSGEARSSAFWRAVRQEALQPSVTPDGQRREAKPRGGIVVFASDEGLRPVLCAPDDWIAPPSYERRELDEPVGPFTHYFTDADGSLLEPAERALGLGDFVGLSHKSLFKQGLLILREVHADVYAVVSGTEVAGASVALVRDDLVVPFVAEFSGTATRGLVDGWWEVTGCVVRKLTSLPPTLQGVFQLLATMQPAAIGVAGGIRVPEGFYRFAHYLPHVRAYGAERVWIEVENSPPVSCIPMNEDGEWALPSSRIPSCGGIVVKAAWSESAGSARSAEVRIDFVDYVLHDQLKPLRSGFYVLEGCGSPEIEVAGGAHVPLDLMTDLDSCSADLLEFDGTARYLGPGLGEMALDATPGFDWMAVGTAGAPDLLAFIGNPDDPTPPAVRRSPNKGDRRHWKQALGARRAFVRVAPDHYALLDRYPAVRDARASYRRHANEVPDDAPECDATDLKALAPQAVSETPAPITVEAINALTAWSARRGGLAYNDARVLLEPLVGTENPLAIQQLLRAWAECGLLDVVRDSRSGRLTIVARPPVLVRVKRGPEVEATVFGLLSDHREQRLQEAIHTARGGVRHIEVAPPNAYQPRAHRLRGDLSVLERVADQAGIQRGGWLMWPVLQDPPDVFSVQRAFKGLPDQEPLASYKLNAVWNWDKVVFERRQEEQSSVGAAVERRSHNDGSSIYTVRNDRQVICWSYVRNWALLFGYEWSGRRPFRRDYTDALSCDGLSPVHLPLPIARLCTLIGAGLPGPRFVGEEVRAYSYPFGRRLYRLIEKVIPPAWIQCAKPGG
jgi:hypothetical protein